MIPCEDTVFFVETVDTAIYELTLCILPWRFTLSAI